MPELPEVETTCRGISPHLLRQKIEKAFIYQPNLRWEIPQALAKQVPGEKIQAVKRRGKYLLIELSRGGILIHLGMSGSLRILAKSSTRGKHDHFELLLQNGKCLRFTDPRRFGAVLWTDADLTTHRLLAKLGPEPLSDEFDADYLLERMKNRSIKVKPFIMTGEVVVGVGNIYATESLFHAGISPMTSVADLTLAKCEKLVVAIKRILQKAIQAGGTSLKDFVNETGRPGYFQQELAVYGKASQPCPRCKNRLVGVQLAQRQTVYCAVCQE